MKRSEGKFQSKDKYFSSYMHKENLDCVFFIFLNMTLMNDLKICLILSISSMWAFEDTFFMSFWDSFLMHAFFSSFFPLMMRTTFFGRWEQSKWEKRSLFPKQITHKKVTREFYSITEYVIVEVLFNNCSFCLVCL